MPAGDFFGIRQSGLLDFQIGDVFADASIMQSANEAVGEILEQDTELSLEKHLDLRKKLIGYTKNELENLNI